MGSLSGSSTTAAVEKQYDDNASYMADNSLPKARLFVEACQVLLRRLASNMAKGNNSISFRVDLIKQELDEARTWLLARDDTYRKGPDRTLADFRNLRNL